MKLFGVVDVKRLARTGSDRTPLLLTYENQSTIHRKPFNFLNFWTEREDFH